MLPEQYKWLENIELPKMLKEMLAMYGLKEAAGAADNPVILSMAMEVHLDNIYKHDETAWCGLTMAVVAKRAGKPVPVNPLWALNWGKWGTKVEVPMLGDVLTFKRFNNDGKLIGGHVTLYVAEDANYYHCCGGNQSDSINITRIAKSRLNSANRPEYVLQPLSVKRMFVSASGAVSNNEA